MPRPDHPLRPRPETEGDAGPVASVERDGDDRPPSKTQRKIEMHALQDLGEALVLLDPKRFAELAAESDLPERLIDAVVVARGITAWGGRKRQLQFVGRLMREVDPAPIRRRLDLWAHGHHLDSARQHALEQWRERLLAEPDALDALGARFPQVNLPRFQSLIARARDERMGGHPPHAYRELFRELKAIAGLGS